jgi:hypothetical protein
MSTETKITKPDQESLEEFINKLIIIGNETYNHNIIVDLLDKSDLKVADLKLFSDISKLQLKRKKSLVFVVKKINFNSLPKSIIAVPSLQEAKDLIEMDEIERDLGF